MPAAVRGALFLGGTCAANCTAHEHRICDSLRFIANHVTDDRIPVNCLGQLTGQRVHGGRGRIRTSVARKERQIYSLLVLATHPPVLEKSVRHQTACVTASYRQTIQEREGRPSENTKRTRVKRHQPVNFEFQDSLRLTPLQIFWWSWRRELNPRPSDYKSDALPAELRQHRPNRASLPEEVSELQRALANSSTSVTRVVEILSADRSPGKGYPVSIL